MSDLDQSLSERKAEQAFVLHSSLLQIERDCPSVRDMPIWTILRQDAYEAFALAFGDV